MIILSKCVKCPTETIVDPPRIVFEDFFDPQIVQVIHPIEIVIRRHCIPVPEHIVTFTVRDENCNIANASVSSRNKQKKSKG
jgi:hypothetical protein